MSRKLPPEQVLAEGSFSRHALTALEPHFSRMKSSAISRLQAAQRAGDLSVEKAIAIAVELNALDDLQKSLDRAVLGARQLQEKLHNEKGD